MKALLLRAVIALATCYGIVCLLVFLGQRRLLYFPGPPPEVTPDALELEWRQAEIRTQDGESLGAWLIEAEEPRGAILVSHGNAGNIAGRIQLAAAFTRMGLSVLLYDYRGYGDSTGSPTESGLYADAEASFEWLVKEGFAPEQIVLYGESLGGGIATELALRVDPAALVLDHTFRSVPAIGGDVYPWLPVRWLARDVFDNEGKIGRVACPVLVVHSPDDELIPVAHGRKLFERAADPKTWLETEGGHNDAGFLARREYTEVVEQFLDDALEP